MAELLILEFENFAEGAYEKVNSELGIDMRSGEGDWPDGLVSHTAGHLDGGFIVVEVWESQEDQEDFMRSRLGLALQNAGVQGPPKRAEWSKLRAHHTPRKASSKSKAATS
jgi:hypothetical protein